MHFNLRLANFVLSITLVALLGLHLAHEVSLHRDVAAETYHVARLHYFEGRREATIDTLRKIIVMRDGPYREYAQIALGRLLEGRGDPFTQNGPDHWSNYDR